MEEIISDFKSLLYKIQLWFENKPTIYYVTVIMYTILSIILMAVAVFGNLSSKTRLVIFLILAILWLLIIFIDYTHVKIIISNRFELEERKRLISELVSLGTNIYKVESRYECYDIESDGDAIFTRNMMLEYDDKDVSWAEMVFGTTNDYGKNFNELILHSFTFPDTKHPLSRVPIEKTASRLRFAIILRNKLSNTHLKEGFSLRMKWKSVWKSLINNLKDDGIVRFDHDTKKFILEIVLPQSYMFVNFYMPRTNSEPYYGVNDNGRNYVSYELSNIEKGESFSYFLEVKKESQ